MNLYDFTIWFEAAYDKLPCDIQTKCAEAINNANQTAFRYKGEQIWNEGWPELYSILEPYFLIAPPPESVLDAKHIGSIFDLCIFPDNLIRLKSVGSETIEYQNVQKLWWNSDVLIITTSETNPLTHKFISMAGHWAYVGPMENSL